MSTRAHFQNEYAKRVRWWEERGELFEHCARKAWQHRLYDGRVEIGDPLPTPWHTREALKAAGIVGLYGYRRCERPMDATPRVNDHIGTLVAMLRDAGYDDLADEVIRRGQSSMFERVRLVTRDNLLVEDVVIPRFGPPAEVLIWGERCFTYREERDGRKIYSEALMWPVLPQEQYQGLEL